MPRTRLSDYLLTYRYHLLDVSMSWPPANVPPWILTPSAGFASITAPEINVETKEIVEGNADFTHHVLGKASTNEITLSQGVSTFNSDFWRWTVACIQGRKPEDITNLANLPGFLLSAATFKGLMPPAKRRNLLLFHFTGVDLMGLVDEINSGDPEAILKAILFMPVGAAVEAITYVQDKIKDYTMGMIDFGITSIPGKVFLLEGAHPTGYKPASDFDAGESAVSIGELKLHFHSFEEFSLSA